LVIGGTGFLGRKLLDLLKRRHEAIGTCHSTKEENFIQVDITKEEIIKVIEKINPHVIVHTAAIVDPDFCELNKEEAWKTNVIGTRNIVIGSKRIGAKLVYISSDYVFNTGIHSEDSIPQPSNYYGWTKLEGEREVREELSNYIIIRPTVMYGFSNGKMDRFTAKVRSLLSKRKNITVSPKIIKYPVLVDDVAQFISTLLDLNCQGIYHIAGPTPISRYNWACLIARTYNLDETLIQPGQEDRIVQSVSGIQLLSTKNPIPKVTPLEDGIQIAKMQERCILRMLYFDEPYIMKKEKSVASIRERLGELLAKYCPANGDIICPVPLSGYYYALGYSKESKIPLEMALYKEREDKMLFKRERKIRVIRDLVVGKRVILVDEAIFTGKTVKNLAEELKENGVREIHVRVIYFPLSRCKFRVLDGLKLISEGRNLDDIKKELGVDSINFLSSEKYPKSIIRRTCTMCLLDQDKGVIK
jgi:dTDP-4-dehydrorhamnose reductase